MEPAEVILVVDGKALEEISLRSQRQHERQLLQLQPPSKGHPAGSSPGHRRPEVDHSGSMLGGYLRFDSS